MSLADEAAALAPYVAQIPWYDLRTEIDRELCERSLAEFLKQSWQWFDSSPYTHGWHIDAVCEHLEAVSHGEIRRLIINIPPRHCLPGDEMVHTELGLMPIGEIVASRRSVKVVSWSQDRNVFELQPVIDWHNTPAGDIYELQFDDGTTLRCTGEHKLLMANGHWLAASDMPIGTCVMIGPQTKPLGGFAPIVPTADVVNVGKRHAVLGCQYFGIDRALRNLSRLLGCQLRHCALEIKRRAVSHRIGVVLGLGAIAKVVETVIRAAAVKMADFGSWLSWADERQDYQFVDGSYRSSFYSVLPQANHSIPASAYCGSQDPSGASVSFAVASCLCVRKAADTPHVRHFIPREVGDSSPHFARLIRIARVGHASHTYCLTVRDNHNFVAGTKQGIIVSNSKTNIVAIAWPCWTWARKPDPSLPLVGPGTRFLCASYGANKAQQDGVTARRLIGSEWYQQLWGRRVVIAQDRDNQEQYDTTAGGSRISTGIPESLGKGGIIRIIDDPVKTDEVESEKVMDSIIRAYDEVWSTRSNNAMIGAEVIIMQRLGERDLSGHVLERSGWVHLCLPARYEPQRHCSTSIGWEDPRTEDGEPLAPDRFPEIAMRRLEREVGPIAWAGQYQQRPEPRGGNIIKRDWWQVWPPDGEEDSWVRPLTDESGAQVYKNGEPQSYTLFPDFEYVVVSLDGAYTTKEENDWSALTVWGAFVHRGRHGIMLIGAERVRMELHELVMRTKEVCTRRKADMLLIEAKATGISVGQEIRRLMRGPEWRIVLNNPEKDKVARLHSVVPMFSSGMIYAPRRRWADMVIDEVTSFPKGKYDDLTDTCSQCLSWLRKNGLARLQTEADEDDVEDMTFVGNRESVVAGYET